MNRREAVVALGALALSACTDSITAPVITHPVVIGVHLHNGFASPRPEYGHVPGTQCPYQYPWKAMKTSDRVPLWGEYDERESWVTEKRVGLMRESGISFAIYQIDTDYRAMRMVA
jgi:hypothetical protein